MSTNGTRSPGETVNCETVLMFSPWVSTGVRKQRRIRPRDRDERVVDAPDPRHDPAEVEPDHELGAHLDLAGETFDDADDVRACARAAA